MQLHTEQDFSLTILVTVAYFFLFEIWMGNQIRCKPSTHRFDHRDKTWECADRSFSNLVEQSPAFLVLLWLYAFFVDSHTSGVLGGTYLAFRAFFPLFWAWGGQWNLFVEFSTQPCYLILAFFKYALVYRAWFEKSLIPSMDPSFFVLCGKAMGGHMLLFVVVFLPFRFLFDIGFRSKSHDA